MSTELNPYEPPAVAGQLLIDEPQRYEFDVVVNEYDIQRATRRLGPSIFSAAIMCTGVLLTSLLAIVGFFRSPDGAAIFFALACLVLLALLVRLSWMRFGLGLARQRIRATPLCVGHLQGRVTETALTVRGEHASSTYPLRACCFAEVRGGSLIVAFDQRRLFPLFFPYRAFAPDCFGQVANLLIHYAQGSQVSPAIGMLDLRVLDTENFVQIDTPENGVNFSGPLLTQDVIATPFRDQIKKFKRIILLVALALNVFVGTHVIYAFRSNIILFGIGLYVPGIIFLLVVNLLFWKYYRGNVGWVANPDQTVMYARGKIAKEGVYASTATGGTAYQWSVFTSAAIGATAISLVLPGKLGHQLILARRQFATDADWESMVALVREQSHRFPISG